MFHAPREVLRVAETGKSFGNFRRPASQISMFQASSTKGSLGTAGELDIRFVSTL